MTERNDLAASKDVAVIGLGYVGLPVAKEAAASGLSVAGLDLSEKTVSGLMSGSSHVDDISDAEVAEMLERGFTASASPEILDGARVIVICVPTPLGADGSPDLSAVTGACREVTHRLQRGTLVVLESTTWPGTTVEVVKPLLEESGLVAGSDFHLAFSPERIDPGNPVYGLRNTPKVVGGLTDGCTAIAQEFYENFVDVVVPAAGPTEAEMTKLLENTYRHINIALVNEMAKFCHELSIDIWDVIRCAATKPFGFHAFTPGPGVGGHCIPIDPNYLSHRVRAKLGYPFRFVELAQEINASMPRYVYDRTARQLNVEGKPVRGSRVLLLGVTYKANIADQRESPAIGLAEELLSSGAELAFCDPYVTEWAPTGTSVLRQELEEGLADADIAILLQRHDAFSGAALQDSPAPILDTTGSLTGAKVTRL